MAGGARAGCTCRPGSPCASPKSQSATRSRAGSFHQPEQRSWASSIHPQNPPPKKCTCKINAVQLLCECPRGFCWHRWVRPSLHLALFRMSREPPVSERYFPVALWLLPQKMGLLESVCTKVSFSSTVEITVRFMLGYKAPLHHFYYFADI